MRLVARLDEHSCDLFDEVYSLIDLQIKESVISEGKALAQLINSDEINPKLSFSYAVKGGIPQSEWIVQNGVEQSLKLGQSKVSTAEEDYFPKKFR